MITGKDSRKKKAVAGIRKKRGGGRKKEYTTYLEGKKHVILVYVWGN